MTIHCKYHNCTNKLWTIHCLYTITNACANLRKHPQGLRVLSWPSGRSLVEPGGMCAGLGTSSPDSETPQTSGCELWPLGDKGRRGCPGCAGNGTRPAPSRRCQARVERCGIPPHLFGKRWCQSEMSIYKFQRFLTQMMTRLLTTHIKGEVSPNNNVDWVSRKQFYKPNSKSLSRFG